MTSEAVTHPLMTHLHNISLAYWWEPHAKYVMDVADANTQHIHCFIRVCEVSHESQKTIEFVSYGAFLTIPHLLILMHLLFSKKQFNSFILNLPDYFSFVSLSVIISSLFQPWYDSSFPSHFRIFLPDPWNGKGQCMFEGSCLISSRKYSRLRENKSVRQHIDGFGC